jgi:ketosteroid isomerase-like protein
MYTPKGLERLLADHSEDIQMCDVPPPNEVRGIEAYRETWPPLFEWQKQGAAAFDRCGTEAELRKDPDNRPCLSIGLRKEGGRWVVSHEHHSFPARDCGVRSSGVPG